MKKTKPDLCSTCNQLVDIGDEERGSVFRVCGRMSIAFHQPWAPPRPTTRCSMYERKEPPKQMADPWLPVKRKNGTTTFAPQIVAMGFRSLESWEAQCREEENPQASAPSANDEVVQ